MNDARAKGLIAFRSAGSHSPIDVVIINSSLRQICLIQSKAGEFSETEKEKLNEKYKYLNGHYEVRFYVA